MEQHLRVERAAARDEAAHEPPVARAAAVDVARAEHEVGVLRGRDRAAARPPGRARSRSPSRRRGRRRARARGGTRPGTRGRAPPSARGAARAPRGAPPRAGPRSPRSRPASRRRSRAPRAVQAELAERAHHRLEVLALVVRRQADRRPAHGPYHRGVAKTLPRNADVADQFDLLADFLELEGSDQFRAARLPPRRAAHARDRRLDRAARGRGQGEGAVRNRQDDRGEDRPDRRGRARSRRSPSGAARPAGRRRVHAPAGPRPEDGAPHLAGARRRDARRPEEGRRDASSSAR